MFLMHNLIIIINGPLVKMVRKCESILFALTTY